MFEPGILFQGKKNVFLTSTMNEHREINVISTELKKAGCNVHHLFDDTDIDIIKLVVQISLKCLYNYS